MRCETFNSIIGLYSLDVNNMSKIVTSVNVSTHSPGRQAHLWLRTIVLESCTNTFPKAHCPMQCMKDRRDGEERKRMSRDRLGVFG